MPFELGFVFIERRFRGPPSMSCISKERLGGAVCFASDHDVTRRLKSYKH